MRGERAQHHRCPAALTADEFGNAIDIFGGERDDRRTARQTGELFRAGVRKIGKPGAGDEVGARHETLDQAAHRIGAEKHRFFLAAREEQPVGEDMAALRIGAELDFVDHQAGDAYVQRHRLDGADVITRVRGNDFFFAGDEGGGGGAFEADDLVVNLPRQKAQGKADHAGAMGQHPLDGKMSLAGIGGAEDRGDPPGCVRTAALGMCGSHVQPKMGAKRERRKRWWEGG